MIRTLLVLLVFALGCGGTVPPTRYYHLPSPAAGRPTGSGAMLVLEPLTTESGYDDERMVYRTNPYRFDYYDYHRWSASPGVLVGNYLEQAFERSGKFRSVVREATADAALVMTGRVIAIEEIDEPNGQWVGHIVLELQLTDEALHAAAAGAAKRKTGARGLRTIIEEVLLDVMYEIPSRSDVRRVVVTPEAIDGTARPLLLSKNEQLVLEGDEATA